MTVANRQEAVVLDAPVLERWRALGAAALELIASGGIAKEEPPGRADVVIVDDAVMARLHGDFLSDPTPTDVMTFPADHGGEIVISIETAARQGAEYGNTMGREACLYIVHGLLHLCGYEDRTAQGRAEMEERQERLLEQAEALLPDRS